MALQLPSSPPLVATDFNGTRVTVCTRWTGSGCVLLGVSRVKRVLLHVYVLPGYCI